MELRNSQNTLQSGAGGLYINQRANYLRFGVNVILDFAAAAAIIVGVEPVNSCPVSLVIFEVCHVFAGN